MLGSCHRFRFFPLRDWLPEQTFYRLLTEELPGVLVAATLCALAARSLAKDRPKLRVVLLSSVVVLPGVWAASFVVGLRFPIPALDGPLYHVAPMPPQFLALKFVDVLNALYTLVLSTVFFRKKGLGSGASTRRHRLQNMCLGFMSLAWSLNQLNAYVSALAIESTSSRANPPSPS